MDLDYQNEHNQLLENMLIIGGSARSGTTILAKLIHSLENVEYYFEPPLLVPLLLKAQKLSLPSLKELIHFYFYDSFLLDCLAGRNINLNLHDDSCIYHCKTAEDINNRASQSFRRHEIESRIKKTKFSFKLPEITFHLDLIAMLFPKSQIILIHRNPADVIQSVAKKGWFSDELLNSNHPAQLYSRKILKNKKIPFWVKPEDEAEWVDNTEYNRCAYYYERISDCVLNRPSSAMVVNYEHLINDGNRYFKKISEKLNLTPTTKTAEILAAVKKPAPGNNNVAGLVDKNQWRRVNDLHQLLSAQALTG